MHSELLFTTRSETYIEIYSDKISGKAIKVGPMEIVELDLNYSEIQRIYCRDDFVVLIVGSEEYVVEAKGYNYMICAMVKPRLK